MKTAAARPESTGIAWASSGKGLGLRHRLLQLRPHSLERLDRDHALEAGHEVAGELAGAGGEVDDGRAGLECELGDDPIQRRGRVVRPPALVGAGGRVEGLRLAIDFHARMVPPALGRGGAGRRESSHVVRPSSKPRPPLPEGPFLVVGLARSGQAAARLLASRGETVRGADSGSPGGAEGLRQAGVEVHLDGDGVGLLDETRCVVKSPGVPREAPVVAAAEERGIEVIGELELAWRALPNAFVAVTGTNGKTTVDRAARSHLARGRRARRGCGQRRHAAERALSATIDPDATVICECSCFQLEDASAFAPECAVLLNVAPDHLDRHGDLDDYREAKLRIFAKQVAGDVADLRPG